MRWPSFTAGVDQASATTIGKVTGIIVDPGSASITALLVDGSDARGLVDWMAAGGVGPDAVTIDSTDTRRLPRDDHEQRAVDGDLDLPCKSVYDETGTRLGKLRDLTFNPASGKLETLLLDNDEDPILGKRLLGADTQSVVVRAASSP